MIITSGCLDSAMVIVVSTINSFEFFELHCMHRGPTKEHFFGNIIMTQVR